MSTDFSDITLNPPLSSRSVQIIWQIELNKHSKVNTKLIFAAFVPTLISEEMLTH